MDENPRPRLPPNFTKDGFIHYEFKAPPLPRVRWRVPDAAFGSNTHCPYCGSTMPEPSQEHIFPAFLGGRRRIVAGKDCNNTLGHTVEAKAETEVFTPFYVFLSMLGLKHVRQGIVWRNAFEREGLRYNLVADDGAARERLAKPMITRGPDGQVRSGQFPDEKSAKAFIEHAEKQGHRVVTTSAHPGQNTISSLMLGLDLGPTVLRPALKIAIAAATLLGVPHRRIAAASHHLLQPGPGDRLHCTVAAVGYPDVRDFGKPLSHIVYVESNRDAVYAVVQFFGAIDIWCTLSDQREDGDARALYGALDPLTGKERFEYTTPLGLFINFEHLLPPEAYEAKSLQHWIGSSFQRQAIKRGGKDIPLRPVFPPESTGP